jgi:hypothetical protein
VSGSAKRLCPVVSELRGNLPLALPGYRTRILDGNHLAASEKRLKLLRSLRGTALPGHSLVVYDPDLGLVLDVIPCEDAYAGERTLMPEVLPTAQDGDLWIGDRNFSTNGILFGFHRPRAQILSQSQGHRGTPQGGKQPHRRHL